MAPVGRRRSADGMVAGRLARVTVRAEREGDAEVGIWARELFEEGARGGWWRASDVGAALQG